MVERSLDAGQEIAFQPVLHGGRAKHQATDREAITPEKLSRCFRLSVPAFDGGCAPQVSSGHLTAASLFALVKGDDDKIQAIKLGWGDFEPAANTPHGMGASKLQGIGAVFILRQYGSYFFERDEYKQLKEEPQAYLARKAAYVVMDGRLLINNHEDGLNEGMGKLPIRASELTHLPQMSVEMDLAAADFQRELPIPTMRDFMVTLRNRVLETRMTPKDITEFIQAFPTNVNDAAVMCYELHRQGGTKLAATFQGLLSMGIHTFGIANHDRGAVQSLLNLLASFDEQKGAFR